MLAEWSVVVGWTEPRPLAEAIAETSPSPSLEEAVVHESADRDAFVWRVPMAGYRKRDVEVTAHGSELRIRAERAQGLWSRTHARIDATLAIPDAVDPLAIEASFAD